MSEPATRYYTAIPTDAEVGGTTHLIEASSPAAVLRHVAGPMWTIKPASTRVAVDLMAAGVKPEKA